ncbi:MAG: ABC transporter permease [Clostridia bacterium]|nr:ABC transporter permease [Clostridia bacterium]
MRRTLAFIGRNFKEILRDPISYAFGLGLPVVMLIAMTAINNAIPPEAAVDIFKIKNLSCGIAVFSLTFVMLEGSILVSKDRSGAFLTRLYSSPMRAEEFIIGYAVPLAAVAVCQMAITFLSSAVVGAVVGETLVLGGILCSFAALLPAALFFVGLGIAFGFLLGQTSAPPVCSFVITASGLLGGIWFDCASVGGAFETVCRVLPFFNATDAARLAMSGGEGFLVPVLITAAYAMGSLGLACVTFLISRKR